MVEEIFSRPIFNLHVFLECSIARGHLTMIAAMRGRQSGMPDEDYWNTFFNVELALDELMGKTPILGDLVEFGCGYGTFTFAAAKRMNGIVTALDIDAELVEFTKSKSLQLDIKNISAERRDFTLAGTGLPDSSQSHAMIYNLLHLEDPVSLLREAFRVLRSGGILSVMHWRSDIDTPRGPSLNIRPKPEQCTRWLEEAGFNNIQPADITASCPYHFGLQATRLV